MMHSVSCTTQNTLNMKEFNLTIFYKHPIMADQQNTPKHYLQCNYVTNTYQHQRDSPPTQALCGIISDGHHLLPKENYVYVKLN